MKNKNVKGLYLILCLILFVVMFQYCAAQSFWHDELYQLGLVRKGISFQDIIKSYAQLWDYTPPLYALISAVWLRLVPFSDKWLLLPSEIFVVLGVYILAVTAEKAAGKRVGVLTAILGATSSTLILNAGHEFRSYALFFMASSLVLAAYLNCHERERAGEKTGETGNTGNIGETGKKYVLLGLTMIILAYSHYYGLLILFVLGVADLWLFIKKKRTVKFFIPYGMCAVCFIPWLAAVLSHHRTSMTTFWTEQPDFMTVIKTIRYLLSDNELLWIVLIVGSVILCQAIFHFIRTREWSQEQSLVCQLLFVVGAVFIGMYLYAAYINPRGGAFQDRYFIGLIPYLLLAVAIMCERLYLSFMKGKGVSFLVFTAVIFIYLASGSYLQTSEQANKKREPYEQSIQVLKKKGDIDKETTAVVVSDCTYVTSGYQYMFERRGKKVKVEIISQEDERFSEKLSRYDKLYVLSIHNELLPKSVKLLENSFERLYKDGRTGISAYKRKE